MPDSGTNFAGGSVGPPLRCDAPLINIVGTKVALGPIRRELVPLYQKWMNDFDVTTTLGLIPRPWTLEAEQVWYDDAMKKTDEVRFTIYERTELIPIGTAGLRSINYFNGTAEFGISIGEKSLWNRGMGTEATRLVLGYGFRMAGLRNIMLRVFEFNDRAIRAYKKAGFQEIGRRRKVIRRGGEFCDEILMDCLIEEFDRGSADSKTTQNSPVGS